MPITVVIPAYRRPDMIGRALRSVHAQTRQAEEVIVVDDASGDDTGTRAESLGARVITHERNLGEGPARNTGIGAARHDWVALLDCDDEWLPHHLATVWEARDGHVVVGAAVLGTGEGPGDHRIYGWSGRRPFVLRGPADVAAPENKLTPSAVMLDGASAMAAGGFRPLPRAADLDMWVRLLGHGSGVSLPTVTALYHVHAGQVSGDSKQMHDAHRAVLRTHAKSPWCTRALMQRHDGVVAWDTMRAELVAGAPKRQALARLAKRVARPQAAAGVMQLLWGRLRARRAACRVAPGGGPMVLDLRDLSLGAALLHVVRRPPAAAIAGGRLVALLVRAASVRVVREGPGPDATHGAR